MSSMSADLLPTITIVCVYNNKSIFRDYLLKSLNKQNIVYELIAIDNSCNSFKSASSALNYAGTKASGNYIMFVHQDVMLLSDSWLQEAEKMLKEIGNFLVNQRNRIFHGNNWRPWGRVIKRPEIVQTLDECLTIIPKSIFNVFKFDEQICNGWHLYVVDYCLKVKLIGLNSYVIPMLVHHRSTGTSPKTFLGIISNLGHYQPEYYNVLEKLLMKYRCDFNIIYTTCGIWKTRRSLRMQRIIVIIKDMLMFPFHKIAEIYSSKRNAPEISIYRNS